jgi:hypothetical protein
VERKHGAVALLLAACWVASHGAHFGADALGLFGRGGALEPSGAFGAGSSSSSAADAAAAASGAALLDPAFFDPSAPLRAEVEAEAAAAVAAAAREAGGPSGTRDFVWAVSPKPTKCRRLFFFPKKMPSLFALAPFQLLCSLFVFLDF